MGWNPISAVSNAVSGVAKTAGGLLSSVPVVGGLAAGLLGMQDKAPQLQEAQLDPATKALFEERGREAMKDPQTAERDIVNQQNAHVGDAGTVLRGGSIDSPMRDALARREQRGFDSLTNKMRRSDTYDAPKTQAGRIAGTMSAVRNDAQHAMAFAQQVKLADQNKRFIRNNAINSILQGGGALAGLGIGQAQGGEEGARKGAIMGQTIGGVAGQIGTPGGNISYL